MANVSKRLATDEGLKAIADAIKNTEAVQQAKAEIQAEGAAQVQVVQNAAQEIAGKVDQIQNNTDGITELKSDLSDFEKSVSTKINLNDEVYEYGRFASNGNELNDDNPITSAFRSKNYIPVIGGKTIEWFATKFDTFTDISQHNMQIVQYDINKNIIVERVDVVVNTHKYETIPYQLQLNVDTVYIRFDVYLQVADLSNIEIALFYSENAKSEYISSKDSYFIKSQKIKGYYGPLNGKKLVFDGDSICESRTGDYMPNGGAFAKIIADKTNATFVNKAVGGGILRTRNGITTTSPHSVYDALNLLPTDGDLYCFEGGINDYWGNAILGDYSKTDYTSEVDPTTVCGALESIFRYAINNFVGKPIVFVIVHKIQNTFSTQNSQGDTFQDYHDKFVGICNKYSIPYFDAFNCSGLNGWNTTQVNSFLNGTSDACHPNEEGYKKYYVPQLQKLFESLVEN